MADFCTCGAQLPPDARFCHKCGKPQYDYPEVEVPAPVQAPIAPPTLPTAAPARGEISFKNGTAVRISFMVAVLAMIFFLLPGPLLFPILRLIIGFFLAGFIAARWYERRTGQRLSTRSGARIGWITGIFSFAMFVAMATAAMFAIASQGGLADFYKKQMPAQDPNVEQVIKLLNDPTGSALFMVMFLILFFVVFTTLPMLGGAVGAKLSEKRA